MFKLYLELGFTHILDLAAYDHMLFLLALVAFYVWKDWKKVLILATAFTIGHSLTLALVVLNVFTVPVKLVEVCIPVTIILTAIYNISRKGEDENNKVAYLLALFFGLIHGMGFSNQLRSSIMPGESLLSQLLAFNIGLELGQVIFVIVVLVINTLIRKLLGNNGKHWPKGLSILAILVSLKLIFDLLN